MAAYAARNSGSSGCRASASSRTRTACSRAASIVQRHGVDVGIATAGRLSPHRLPQHLEPLGVAPLPDEAQAERMSRHACRRPQRQRATQRRLPLPFLAQCTLGIREIHVRWNEARVQPDRLGKCCPRARQVALRRQRGAEVDLRLRPVGTETLHRDILGARRLQRGAGRLGNLLGGHGREPRGGLDADTPHRVREQRAEHGDARTRIGQRAARERDADAQERIRVRGERLQQGRVHRGPRARRADRARSPARWPAATNRPR